MNGKNRTSRVIGMLVVLVGIFSSVVLAEGVESESNIDATVVQIAHWQAMNPNFTDSTEVQVAHWQAMNPNLTDSTEVQVAHWQAMNPNLTDSTEVQVAHRQAMNPNLTDSTEVQVAHWQTMAKIAKAHELINTDGDVVAKVIVQR